MGEAACVSVHGANRLGSNSLIDLVVFGRAAGLRAEELIKPGETQPELPKDSGRSGADPARPFPQRQGRFAHRGFRAEMQRTMQAHCAVFRTDELMAEGVEQINEVKRGCATSTSPTAR